MVLIDRISVYTANNGATTYLPLVVIRFVPFVIQFRPHKILFLRITRVIVVHLCVSNCENFFNNTCAL